LAALIATGDVSFTFLDAVIPSHAEYSQPAAEAVNCAGDQDKYWAMHGVLLANQKNFTKTQLKDYAKQLGLDTNAFNQCLDSGKYRKQVQNSTNEAFKKIEGTPTFFINGQQQDLGGMLSNFSGVVQGYLKK
jgi:protein-disulfide isomerase